jgi:hypothetical protein
MTVPIKNTTNAEKIALLQATFAEALAESLRRGFFGSVSIEFSIQDGTIQCVRKKTEKLLK